MENFQFERLNVWNLSRDLAKSIYILTSRFPKDELFGLTSQIRRAIVSVSSNIAEGSGRTGIKDQLHFFEIAYGSLLETYSQLILSTDLCYLNKEDIRSVTARIFECARMLSGLRKSTESRLKQYPPNP